MKVEEQVIKGLPVTRANDFRIYYSNHIRVKIGKEDIQINFGSIDELPEKNMAVAIESCGVVLPPSQAKIFANTFIKIIEAYEKQFGTIPVEITEEQIDKSLQNAVAQRIEN